MRTRLAISICALLCVMICLAPSTLSAQSTQGSIVGLVTDPSGAGIAGASVQVVNQGNAYLLCAKPRPALRETIASLESNQGFTASLSPRPASTPWSRRMWMS